MDVSIIIINYNTTKLTEALIHSIEEHTLGVSFEIIVVDNASPNRDIDALQSIFPDGVCIIKSETNLGFGGANNLGLKRACGKYVFFLNPDTILLNNAIYMMYEFMEKKNVIHDIGAVGTFLLDKNKKETLSFSNFPTAIYIIKEKLRLNSKKNITKEGSFYIVDYIAGADMFVEKTIFDNIGTFDERFFMYFEETDLQKRMQIAGLKRILIDGPQIVHLEGGSFEKKNKKNGSARRRYLYTKSALSYVKKYHSRPSYLIFRIVYFLICIPAYINRNYSMKDNLNLLRLNLFIW